MIRVAELNEEYFDPIRDLFKSVFTAPPWNEPWEDDQLTEYLLDLMSARTPLILGIFDEDELIGVSIGNIRHWCGGTEYFIEEFFIKTEKQNRGFGTRFISLIESHLMERGIFQIFLMTDRNMPACEFYRKRGFTEIPEHISFFREL